MPLVWPPPSPTASSLGKGRAEPSGAKEPPAPPPTLLSSSRTRSFTPPAPPPPPPPASASLRLRLRHRRRRSRRHPVRPSGALGWSRCAPSLCAAVRRAGAPDSGSWSVHRYRCPKVSTRDFLSPLERDSNWPTGASWLLRVLHSLRRLVSPVERDSNLANRELAASCFTRFEGLRAHRSDSNWSTGGELALRVLHSLQRLVSLRRGCRCRWRRDSSFHYEGFFRVVVRARGRERRQQRLAAPAYQTRRAKWPLVLQPLALRSFRNDVTCESPVIAITFIEIMTPSH